MSAWTGIILDMMDRYGCDQHTAVECLSCGVTPDVMMAAHRELERQVVESIRRRAEDAEFEEVDDAN